jgi:hypothetical protein
MLIDYETQTELLVRRQEQEMDALTIANERRIVLIKRGRDKSVSAAKQRIQNIQTELSRAKEPRALATGCLGRGKRMLPTARGRARTAPINMIHICTVKLQPIVPSQGRRPGIISSSAVIRRK